MFRNLIIVAALIFGVNGASAQEVLTLEKALEIAFQNSPSLIQSKLSLQQSELNLAAQKSSLKSQFSLNVDPFNYSRSNTYDDINSSWYDREVMSSSASLGIVQPIKFTDGTISLMNNVQWQKAKNHSYGGSNTSFTHDLLLRLEQPLFTYNRTKMTLRELEFALETARLNYSLQQLNIERNVTTNFYDVYKSQRELSIAREEYANQKQNYEIIKSKVEAGLVAAEELYQAEVNLATSESSLYSQEINYENNKDNFKILLGISIDEDIAVLPNIQVTQVNVSVDQAVKYGLEQRMEIRQQQIVIERDLFSIIRANSENEFKGSISAQVGLNFLGEKVKNMYDKPTDSEQIGISFTIPLYDWGAKKARVESSELAKESDEVNLEEQKKEIVVGIRQICRNIPVLINQVNIQKKSVENAERTYEINLEKYRNGNLTGMQLQQYQTQLTDAKQSYTNAIINYKIELLNLKIQTLWNFETDTTYLPVDLLKTNK
ncbi:MAG: TolC family protein [Culturomica sp.]|jgi:outer membrane protein TolC|nr:TolC family protein [Culturomica sp.]